jgi:hypothetical protein
MQSILCLFLTGGLISCKSLTEPDFYRMSAAELHAYNSTVPGPEQVKCVKVTVAVDNAAKRICGTLQEIQHLSQPIAPGARIDNFFPTFSHGFSVTRNKSVSEANDPATPSVAIK